LIYTDAIEWSVLKRRFDSILAAAYAESRDWDHAIRWQKKVIELARDKAEKQAAEEVLQPYQAKRPLRDGKKAVPNLVIIT
jgi:hypothetical protein